MGLCIAHSLHNTADILDYARANLLGEIKSSFDHEKNYTYMGPFAFIAARCLKNRTSSRWGDGHTVYHNVRSMLSFMDNLKPSYTVYVYRLVHDKKSDTFRARGNPAFNINPNATMLGSDWVRLYDKGKNVTCSDFHSKYLFRQMLCPKKCKIWQTIGFVEVFPACNAYYFTV